MRVLYRHRRPKPGVGEGKGGSSSKRARRKGGQGKGAILLVGAVRADWAGPAPSGRAGKEEPDLSFDLRRKETYIPASEDPVARTAVFQYPQQLLLRACGY